MSKTKRSLSAILAVIILLIALSSGAVLFNADAVWDGSVASGFSSGSGTSSSPYVIGDASQLAYLSSAVASGNAALSSAYYVLGADIFLNDISDYLSWYIPVGSGDGVSDTVWFGSETSEEAVAPANGWTPIGTAAHPFSGNFNGNGHFIRGLYCEHEGYAGLFGYNTGTVTSVAVYYSYVISTGDYAGGIVGYNSGTLTKIANYGKVFSTGRYVGGIAGYSTGAVSNAASYSAVFGGDVVGGIVGENFGGTVTKTLVTGNVEGDGSVCATVAFSRTASSVTNSYYKSGICKSDVYGTPVSEVSLKSGSTVSGLGTVYWEYSAGMYPNVKGLPRGSHVFSEEWTSNADNHWHACTDPGCDAVSEYSAHSGGTATCTDLAVCSVCGVEYGSLAPHTLTHTAYVAADHHHAGNIEYWYCSVCGKYFTNSGCTEETTAEALPLPMIPHSFSEEWTSDADNHWHACSCGDIADSAAHVFDSVCDTTCNVCGYVRTVEHVFDNACDTTCNLCGYVRAVTHAYSGDWSKDGTSHWHVCTVCGDIAEEGAHEYDDAFDGSCNVCGYVREIPSVVTGEAGDNVTWSYDSSSGALSISGEGDAYDFASGKAPWASVAETVSSVTIDKTVTALGENLFEGCTNLSEVTVFGAPAIPEGLFDDCPDVTVKGFTRSGVDTYCQNNGIAFEALEEFEGIGYQIANTSNNKFRFIAQMKYAEYYPTAGYEVHAYGTNGDTAFDKQLDKEVLCVYTRIYGTDENGVEGVVATAQAGYYLSAISFSGLPLMTGKGSIRFDITPYVRNEYSNEKIYGETISLVYDAEGVRQYAETVTLTVDDGEGEGYEIDYNDWN